MSTAETEDTKASEAKASPQDLVLKVLGAIGTGVGVLGFVAFFGGAVLWLRAEKAHLPANDAVSVIPKSVLVTTGASFLVPAVLIALLAVVLIFAVYIVANLPRQNSARQASSEADDLWREVDALREAAESKADQAKATQALLASASGEAAAALLPVAQTHNAEEIEAKRQYHVKKAAAEERSEAAKGKLTQTPVQFRVELWVGFVAVLLAPLIFNKAIFSVRLLLLGLDSRLDRARRGCGERGRLPLDPETDLVRDHRVCHRGHLHRLRHLLQHHSQSEGRTCRGLAR